MSAMGADNFSYTPLDKTLHHLIVMQLEHIVQHNTHYCSQTVGLATIHDALRFIRSVEDMAYVSTYSLHDDKDAMRVSWHRGNASMAVDFIGGATLLENGFFTTYTQSKVNMPTMVSASALMEDGHVNSRVTDCEFFEQLDRDKLRIILERWAI